MGMKEEYARNHKPDSIIFRINGFEYFVGVVDAESVDGRRVGVVLYVHLLRIDYLIVLFRLLSSWFFISIVCLEYDKFFIGCFWN